MANFTITRQTESSDNYGCTNFDTNQIEGEMASLTNGDPLDGSIIWYLDANAGYTVSVDDFEIPGTTPTSAAQTPGTYRTFEGSGIPSPVTASPIATIVPMGAISVPVGTQYEVGSIAMF